MQTPANQATRPRGSAGRRIGRGVVASAILAALVYALMLIAADRRSSGEALAMIEPRVLLAVAALAVANFSLRSIRLWYLLRVCGVTPRLADAFYIYWSGMTMTITPGKVGEVLKAFLARETTGLPTSRGIALVFVERVTDLLAVVALASGGLSLVGAGPWALAAVAGVVIGATWLVSRERLHRTLLRALERGRWARSHVGHADALLDTLRTTLRTRPLANSLLLSTAAWAAEGLGFHLALRGLGFDGLDLGGAVALYAVSTVVGALLLVPGGIGPTEGSMMGVLVAVGATGAVAFAATMIIRVATLWLGVALGWLAFATRPRIMRTFLRDDE